MKKFISLSQYPGRTGQYFYTKFFEHYGIDAEYQPRGTDNLAQSIAHALEEGVDGISVSMPYKQEILRYLDDATGYVNIYQSCNTVVINDKKLIGYNADAAGVDWACNQIRNVDRITILGLGAIASMFIKYLEEDNYGKINIAARSLGTWANKDLPTDVVINATALGTSSTDSPYEQLPDGVKLVIDLAIKDNTLAEQCKTAGIKYLSGIEFYKQQFLAQFRIYTGIAAPGELFDEFHKQY
jgi:shikimate 5-dehydrogenase